MAVDVSTEPTFRVVGNPQPLWEAGVDSSIRPGFETFDLDPEGRLLVWDIGVAPGPREIRVVLNWFEELRRLAPIGS